MKIAVCFYGQLRTATIASNNLKRYFGELYEQIDFFTHTWDIRMDRPLGMLKTIFNEPLKIDNSLIDDYRKIYNHREFFVEDQTKLRDVLYREYVQTQKSDSINELTYPYHSFRSAVTFKQQHEQLHSFKYDAVIKLRPDIIFPPDRYLKNDINEFLKDPASIYICYADDVFHIGSSENMDVAAEYYASCSEDFYQNKIFPFDGFVGYLKEKNISLQKMQDCRFTVLRHELAQLHPIDQYHELCYLNSLFYSEVFYHLKYSWKWWYNSANPNWKEDMYNELQRILHPADFDIVKETHCIDV